MYDLISIGEMLIDFSPLTGPDGSLLYQLNPGGAPANVSCAFSALGGKASFIGKVGDDAFGLSCKNALKNAGCDDSLLVMSKDHPTTLAFVTLSPDGNRDFSFYRNATTADVSLTLDDIPETAYENCRVFHFGSVSLTQEPSRSTVLEAVKRAKAAGALISYDPNLREPLWSSLAEAKAQILSALPLASLVKVSEEEHTFLFPDETEDETGKRLFEEENIPLFVVTKAKNGCTAYLNGKRFDSKAYDVKTIDTTGAGDAFWAALLQKLLESPAPLKDLSDSRFAEILDCANAVGSLTTTRRGAIAAIPSKEEIDACMANTPRI